MTVDQTEMHPSRWGDPTRARALPDEARGLVEMVFGVDDRPAVERPAPAPSVLGPELVVGLGALVGPEHVATDDDTRRLRTRGKSTPDLLRARAGDLTDAPDAVVRPGGHDEVAAVLAFAVEAPPPGGGVGGGRWGRRGGAAPRPGRGGRPPPHKKKKKKKKKKQPHNNKVFI